MKTDGLGKEGFGPSHIASLAEANIYQVAILINAPVQVAPHAFHSNEGLVDQPDFPDLAFPLRPDLFGKMRQEAFLPKPHGFMSELKAPQQEDLSHVPIAELASALDTAKLEK